MNKFNRISSFIYQLASYANQQLNEAMTIIQSECPTEFRSSRLGNVATNKSGQVTIDTLAALRTRLNTAKDRLVVKNRIY